MLEAQQKIKAFDQTVADDADKAAHAQVVHRLGLALSGLLADMVDPAIPIANIPPPRGLTSPASSQGGIHVD